MAGPGFEPTTPRHKEIILKCLGLYHYAIRSSIGPYIPFLVSIELDPGMDNLNPEMISLFKANQCNQVKAKLN